MTCLPSPPQQPQDMKKFQIKAFRFFKRAIARNHGIMTYAISRTWP